MKITKDLRRWLLEPLTTEEKARLELLIEKLMQAPEPTLGAVQANHSLLLDHNENTGDEERSRKSCRSYRRMGRGARRVD